MADRIVLQKLGVAFAPARKITPLKRENRDADKRRFERELTEKGEKKQEDTVDLDAPVRNSVREDDRAEDGSPVDGGEGLRSNRVGQADVTPVVGSVVDIHV